MKKSMAAAVFLLLLPMALSDDLNNAGWDSNSATGTDFNITIDSNSGFDSNVSITPDYNFSDTNSGNIEIDVGPVDEITDVQPESETETGEEENTVVSIEGEIEIQGDDQGIDGEENNVDEIHAGEIGEGGNAPKPSSLIPDVNELINAIGDAIDKVVETIADIVEPILGEDVIANEAKIVEVEGRTAHCFGIKCSQFEEAEVAAKNLEWQGARAEQDEIASQENLPVEETHDEQESAGGREPSGDLNGTIGDAGADVNSTFDTNSSLQDDVNMVRAPESTDNNSSGTDDAPINSDAPEGTPPDLDGNGANP